jgi:hypothetical protein
MISSKTSLRGISLYSNQSHAHWTLKELLVKNFTHQYSIGDLYWPRLFKALNRKNFPKAPPINRVLEAGFQIPILQNNLLCCKSLYIKPSDLRASRDGKVYNITIGNGLFTSLPLKKNTKLGQFQGEIINLEMKEERILAGKGGYMINFNETMFLDCYDSAIVTKTCLLSLANSAYKCYNINTSKKATNNCKLVIDPIQRTATIETLRYINANTELLYNYGNDYIFPNL